MHGDQAMEGGGLHHHEIAEVDTASSEQAEKQLVDQVKGPEPHGFHAILPLGHHDVSIRRLESFAEGLDRRWQVFSVAVHDDHAMGIEVSGDITQADRNGPLVAHVSLQPDHVTFDSRGSEAIDRYRLAHRPIIDGNQVDLAAKGR